MKKTKVTILGDKWEFQAITLVEAGKLYPEDAEFDGKTSFKDKIVYIQDITVETIRHELTHCYYDYMCLESTTDISWEDAEEIHCSFNSRYGGLVAEQAKTIYNKLKGK